MLQSTRGPVRVRRLSLMTAAYIRAGVVVPRLADIAEELILNAIDAKATSVRISFCSQTWTIICQDNGIGMCRDDLQKAGHFNHTSKGASSVEGLYQGELTSYGFKVQDTI